MLFWHTGIAEAQVLERIKRLDVLKAAVFVVGCVTHAKNVLVKAISGTASDEFVKTAQVLGKFWIYYPDSLQPAVIEQLATEAADLFPGEEGGNSGWEDSLIEGTAYSFSHVVSLVTGNRHTEEAARIVEEAIYRAYWSVYAFHHEQDRIYPSEDEIREVEMNSPVCKAEIEFQLAFLAALEAIQGQPPPYATLLQQMVGGN